MPPQDQGLLQRPIFQAPQLRVRYITVGLQILLLAVRLVLLRVVL